MNKNKIILLTLVFGWTNAAFAASYYSSGSGNGIENVAVSGGVTYPSYSTAAQMNPAGVAQQPGANLSLQAGGGELTDPILYRGHIGYGNQSFGLIGGVTHKAPEGKASSNDAYYGFGFTVAPIKLTLGLSGEQNLKSGGGSDYHAGVFLDPTSKVRLAFMGKGLKNTVDAYGVGLGLELNSNIKFVVDGAFDSDFNNNELKPGIVVSNAYAGVTYSYGTGDSVLFNDASTVGVFVKPSPTVNVEFYYNQGGSFEKYHAACSFLF